MELSTKIIASIALTFFVFTKQVCCFSSWKRPMENFDCFELGWRKDGGLHYLEKNRANKVEDILLRPVSRHKHHDDDSFLSITKNALSFLSTLPYGFFGGQLPKIAETFGSTSSGLRRCVFSINGEKDGTLVYDNIDGKFHFKGFVTYPPPRDEENIKSSPKGTFIKTPSILFDDPLPVIPSSILVALGNLFLIKDHVELIHQMRDIITSPLDDSERMPEIGSKAQLSYGFVELAEFIVTPEFTWKPIRFITRHRSYLRGKIERIDWPLGDKMGRGKVQEDPVVISNNHETYPSMGWLYADHPKFVLSEKKLQRLLECQVSLVPMEFLSKYISKGIADNMNGRRGFD